MKRLLTHLSRMRIFNCQRFWRRAFWRHHGKGFVLEARRITIVFVPFFLYSTPTVVSIGIFRRGWSIWSLCPNAKSCSIFARQGHSPQRPQGWAPPKNRNKFVYFLTHFRCNIINLIDYSAREHLARKQRKQQNQINRFRSREVVNGLFLSWRYPLKRIRHSFSSIELLVIERWWQHSVVPRNMLVRSVATFCLLPWFIFDSCYYPHKNRFKAPEIIMQSSWTPQECKEKGGYGKEVDMWSLGGILYVM